MLSSSFAHIYIYIRDKFTVDYVRSHVGSINSFISKKKKKKKKKVDKRECVTFLALGYMRFMQCLQTSPIALKSSFFFCQFLKNSILNLPSILYFPILCFKGYVHILLISLFFNLIKKLNFSPLHDFPFSKIKNKKKKKSENIIQNLKNRLGRLQPSLPCKQLLTS
jgi:hypothetical protein